MFLIFTWRVEYPENVELVSVWTLEFACYNWIFSDVVQVQRDGLQSRLSTHCLQVWPPTRVQSPECGGRAVQPEIWLCVESFHAQIYLFLYSTALWWPLSLLTSFFFLPALMRKVDLFFFKLSFTLIWQKTLRSCPCTILIMKKQFHHWVINSYTEQTMSQRV